MTVNRRRAGVHPDSRRVRRSGDRLSNETGSLNARFFDLTPIGPVIAAVNITSGKIDDKVCVLKLVGPAPKPFSVPPNSPPWRTIRSSGEDNNVVPLGMKVPSYDRAHLARSARQHHAQRPSVHALHYDIHRWVRR
jgi:hypothetical protein